MARKTLNPFVAAMIGILMIPASVCLHAWNEYRTVHRARGLQEAIEIVESIPNSNEVESSMNGKLVHLSGDAISEELLSDPIFGVESVGIQLRRSVQMYQWDEDSEKRDGHTTYSYKKVWREGRIDSSDFDRSGYENPQPHFSAWDQSAARVMIGKYEVSDALKKQKDDEQNVPIDFDAINQTLGESTASQLTLNGEQLYFSDSEEESSSPQIGDLKIQFRLVPNGPVSLMAGLRENTFAAYKTSNGEPIERLYPGTWTAEQVVEKLRFENTLLAWGLRAAGLVVCLIGTMMIFAPAQALFRWIPLVGDIAGGLIFLVALIFAVCLSLTTISIAWIAVRPVLGISLLLVVAGGVYWMNRTRQNVEARKREKGFDDEPILLTEDAII